MMIIGVRHGINSCFFLFFLTLVPLPFTQQLSEFSLTSQVSIQEGTFLGDAKHKDGSLMAVVFQVRKVARKQLGLLT